jgi:hypothetical protein
MKTAAWLQELRASLAATTPDYLKEQIIASHHRRLLEKDSTSTKEYVLELQELQSSWLMGDFPMFPLPATPPDITDPNLEGIRGVLQSTYTSDFVDGVTYRDYEYRLMQEFSFANSIAAKKHALANRFFPEFTEVITPHQCTALFMQVMNTQVADENEKHPQQLHVPGAQERALRSLSTYSSTPLVLAAAHQQGMAEPTTASLRSLRLLTIQVDANHASGYMSKSPSAWLKEHLAQSNRDPADVDAVVANFEREYALLQIDHFNSLLRLVQVSHLLL